MDTPSASLDTPQAASTLQNEPVLKASELEFADFGLHPKLIAAVEALGYVSPTPIQKQAIPVIASGEDVMGLAQTGTGKTAAFVLPMLQRLLTNPGSGVRCLIVAPTRELAEQINSCIKELSTGAKLRSTTIYGGVGMEPQIRTLKAGVDIIVACPGRLLDHIQRRTVNLSKVEVLVLDEADQMFDMGFLPNIRKIVSHLPKGRQNLLFSATMPPDIQKLAQEMMSNPMVLKVGNSSPATTVAHAIYPVEFEKKTALLLRLLDTTDTGSVLIFTRTKHRAKRLGEQLIRTGFAATSLQGNLSQNRRQEALDGFRTGKYQILVATDIAARGIDISQISHVINYDIPDTAEAYTHRIGRTGRAERTGDAYTLVSKEDRAMVRDIEKVLKQPIERKTVADFDYGSDAVLNLFNSPDMPGGHAPRGPSRSRGGNSRGNFQGRTENRRPSSGHTGNRSNFRPRSR